VGKLTDQKWPGVDAGSNCALWRQCFNRSATSSSLKPSPWNHCIVASYHTVITSNTWQDNGTNLTTTLNSSKQHSNYKWDWWHYGTVPEGVSLSDGHCFTHMSTYPLCPTPDRNYNNGKSYEVQIWCKSVFSSFLLPFGFRFYFIFSLQF